MFVNKTFILIFLLLLKISVFGQKIERETRIDKEKAPSEAVNFINDISSKKHVKWYIEKTSGKVSYESKFKHKGSFYSVEFDTLGYIEDVEVIIKPKKLDENHKSTLRKAIQNDFEKFKWIKIQKQYSGEREALKKLFSGSTEHVELNYEIEIEAKTKDGDWELFELLINLQGEILKRRKIQLRPTDNLNY